MAAPEALPAPPSRSSSPCAQDHRRIPPPASWEDDLAMVLASWPASRGRGHRSMPAESIRRCVDEAMRRSIRHAVRLSAPLVALGMGADAVHMALRFGAAGRGQAALAGIAIVITLSLSLMGTRFIRRPEPLALGILVVLYGVTLLNAAMIPGTLPVATGYLAAIIVGSALFLTWSPRWHAAWLLTALALAIVQLLARPAGGLGAGTAELTVAVLAALVSAFGQPVAYLRYRRTLEQQFELRRLSRVARRRERAIEELNGEVVRTARVDTVTGIGNRRALDEAILAMAGRRVAAVLLDLDHFKAFNDRNGHLAGDAALARLGEILRETVRHDDMVFRYGGEEFLILLPGGDHDAAGRLAERVRLAVQDEARSGAWDLTVSAGVAVADRFTASDPVALLRRADAALYQAKRAGRNRVVVDGIGSPRPELAVG